MSGRNFNSITCSQIIWLAFASLVVTGCGPPPVREDRRINFSQDGKSVSFQHGLQGVFVADPATGKPFKIFNTDEKTIAVSSPLWSPTDQRLIFATAQRSGEQASPQHQAPNQSSNPLTDWNVSPDGVQFRAEPVVYTCWLRSAPQAGEIPAPVSLFEAECDHPGYVGANLAVRWHPDGKRILFIDRVTAKHGVALFEFDLANRTKSRVAALPVSDVLLFDWSPDQSRLAVLCTQQASTGGNGIWIGGRWMEQPWWHVPGTEPLGYGTVRDLERLRGSLPAFTADGERFLFATAKELNPASGRVKHTISLGDVAQQSVRALVETEALVRSLRWSPDGRVFGYLSDAPDSALELRTLADAAELAARVPDVRQFIGWDSSGSHVAYVAADSPEQIEKPHWALLLIPDPDARHRVFLANAAGGDAKLAFDKMHITFPQWTPRDQRLSLWGTFMPTHRSILSWLGTPWSLRPGDPAFVLDPKTGRHEWLAVDAHEKSEVGNYYLLKGDYERAWNWYEDARRERAAQPPAKAAISVASLFQPGSNDPDPTFFEYVCLTKLGRATDAAARLQEFRQRTKERLRLIDELPRAAAPAPPADAKPVPADAQLGLGSHAIPFVQDLYVAEAYLSLDMLDDGIAFLQRELEAAASDGERLAHASVLSQLLLIHGDKLEYAQLLSHTWAPALLKHKPAFRDGALAAADGIQQLEQFTYIGFGGAVLAPLLHPDFVADLPDDAVEGILTAWARHREQTKDEVERFATDLVLHAAAGRLGRNDERDAIVVRMKSNPVAAQWLGNEGVEGFLKQVEQTFEQLKQIGRRE